MGNWGEKICSIVLYERAPCFLNGPYFLLGRNVHLVGDGIRILKLPVLVSRHRKKMPILWIISEHDDFTCNFN